MERKIYDCDGCLRTDLKPNDMEVISVATRRYMDAAGSMDTDYESVDLCIKCLAIELTSLLSPRNYAEKKAWLESVKQNRKNLKK